MCISRLGVDAARAGLTLSNLAAMPAVRSRCLDIDGGVLMSMESQWPGLRWGSSADVLSELSEWRGVTTDTLNAHVVVKLVLDSSGLQGE